MGDSIGATARDVITPRIELHTAFPFFGMPQTALHVSSTHLSLEDKKETTYDYRLSVCNNSTHTGDLDMMAESM